MNMLDYLEWRGDITFAERGLNEVDNLIFSELAYVEMDDLVSSDGSAMLTVAQLCEACERAGRKSTMPMNDPFPLLRKAAQTPRFRDIAVGFYVSTVSHEEQSQLSAVTFFYSTTEAYVAFRGTDSTIAGWREDFNLSFLDETPGQRAAAAYLDRVAASCTHRLTVGGHSKGGNFAVYAAAFCSPEIRDTRVVRVFSNDGPGFKREVAESEPYRAIERKTVKYIPGASIVGILLDDREERRFILSSGKALMQHNPYTWCVSGTRLVPTQERTPFSLFLDDTLSRWLDELEPEKRRVLVNTFFDAVTASGARTLDDLNENKPAAYRAFLKALTKSDAERKGEIGRALQRLLSSGMDVMIAGAKKNHAPKEA